MSSGIVRLVAAVAAMAIFGAAAPAQRTKRPPQKKTAVKKPPEPVKQLNESASIAAGQQLRVPAVAPFLADAKPGTDPVADEATIQVTRAESALRATRADGSLVFFAPVTTGSEHDPLPIGDWKVVGVQWRPVFHYNPDLFWDAKPQDARAEIKPGPNNPVGVVWVALSKEHYGLHGTPEPGRI